MKIYKTSFRYGSVSAWYVGDKSGYPITELFETKGEAALYIYNVRLATNTDVRQLAQKAVDAAETVALLAQSAFDATVKTLEASR